MYSLEKFKVILLHLGFINLFNVVFQAKEMDTEMCVSLGSWVHDTKN